MKTVNLLTTMNSSYLMIAVHKDSIHHRYRVRRRVISRKTTTTPPRGRVAVGSDDGVVHVTRDDGKSWEPLFEALSDWPSPQAAERPGGRG